MDFTGRSMQGFVFVDRNVTKTKKDLDYWLGLALAYNKKAKASKEENKSTIASFTFLQL